METPTSMRRVTRSQTKALLQRSKMQEEAKRPPLLDISNDSPITGLKTENTPINKSSKKEANTEKLDPQSDQKLHRNQAKTLLQTFEEEKDEILVTKTIISNEIISIATEEENQSNIALVFDSAEESEISCGGSINSSSLITCETQSQNSSVWSMQVNTSSEKDEIDEDFEEDYEEEYLEEDYEEEYPYENEDEEEGGFFDELCKGMNKMCIMDEREVKNVKFPEFRGTRTKFVYNSEDEIEDEVMILRGLPVPEGTHLRFRDDED